MKKKSDPFDLFSWVGLDRRKIRKLAFETGFCKRHSGKISAPNFVVHLCLESTSGTVSYNDLAARVEARTGIAASRQAYWERTDECCLRFFQSILEHVMLSKCDPHQIQFIKRQGRFKRILLQDSTIIKLPLRLHHFTGTRCFSSSIQFRTMLILRGTSAAACWAPFTIRNRLPLGSMSQ